MTIKFKIKFDKEFQDYYFQPFKGVDDYVWIHDILESNKGLVAITEYGDILIKEIDWKNMFVIAQYR